MSESAVQPSSLIDQCAVLIRGLDDDVRCNYVNPAWTRFTGRSAGAEYGDGWTAGIHPDDRPEVLAAIARNFRRRAPFDLEYRLLRHDRTYRWLIDQGQPLRIGGVFRGYVAASIDVHERREAATAQAALLRVVAAQLRTPLQAARVLAEVARRDCEAGDVPDAVVFEKLDVQFERIHELLSHLSWEERPRRDEPNRPPPLARRPPVTTRGTPGVAGRRPE